MMKLYQYNLKPGACLSLKVFVLLMLLSGYSLKAQLIPTIEWENTINGNGGENIGHVIRTNDGGYMVGGGSTSSAGGDKSEDSNGLLDYWVLKLDADGVIEWDRTYGGDGNDDLHNIIQTDDGGYILSGGSRSGVSGDKTVPVNGFSDVWLFLHSELQCVPAVLLVLMFFRRPLPEHFHRLEWQPLVVLLVFLLILEPFCL